ncbi:unnamed protein product [Gongylonema pulchrum]|uniref:Chitin-binding type-2 domain-containing protein n=1 Tax=Gongylonema pulchrum TaxID=637853 RepID=A0A183DXY4_9BILA|nr:unnamed protein product [Gongylonema pulchrum]
MDSDRNKALRLMGLQDLPIAGVVVDQFQPPNRPPYPLPQYPVPLSPLVHTSDPSVALPPDAAGSAENSTKASQDVEEGSGEEGDEDNEGNSVNKARRLLPQRKRVKRYAYAGLELSRELESWYSPSEMGELCRTKKHAVNVAVGSCRQNYIFCDGKQNVGRFMSCMDGELFDDRLESCVHASHCKRRTRIRRSLINETAAVLFDCSHRADGAYALGCSSKFAHCSQGQKHTFVCQDGLIFDGDAQQCKAADFVPNCRAVDNSASQRRTFIVSVVHEVPTVMPDLLCSIDGFVTLGCSPSFIECDSGIAYMRYCGSGLVFDQVLSCFCISGAANFKLIDSSFVAGDLRQRKSESAVTSDVSYFDCTSARDGVHAFQCSSVFIVCSGGKLTGFVCQEGLVFNLETGFCDQQEYTASCGGAHLIKSPSSLSLDQNKPSPEANFITTQPSYHSTAHVGKRCQKRFNGVISKGCAAEFILCAHGVDHIFTCQHGLVYNIELNRCDYSENVAACTGRASYSQRTYGGSHYENGSIASIRIVDLRAVSPSDSVMKARCSAVLAGSAAYGPCRMDYITCTKEGTAHQVSCCTVAELMPFCTISHSFWQKCMFLPLKLYCILARFCIFMRFYAFFTAMQ